MRRAAPPNTITPAPMQRRPSPSHPQPRPWQPVQPTALARAAPPPRDGRVEAAAMRKRTRRAATMRPFPRHHRPPQAQPNRWSTAIGLTARPHVHREGPPTCARWAETSQAQTTADAMAARTAAAAVSATAVMGRQRKSVWRAGRWVERAAYKRVLEAALVVAISRLAMERMLHLLQRMPHGDARGNGRCPGHPSSVELELSRGACGG